MVAGFYGDFGRVTGFFHEDMQRAYWLEPGWLTAMLDFVEDPAKAAYSMTFRSAVL